MAKTKSYSKGSGSSSNKRLEELEEQLAKGISEGKSAESLKKIQDAIDKINNNLKKSISNTTKMRETTLEPPLPLTCGNACEEHD